MLFMSTSLENINLSIPVHYSLVVLICVVLYIVVYLPSRICITPVVFIAIWFSENTYMAHVLAAIRNVKQRPLILTILSTNFYRRHNITKLLCYIEHTI